MDIKLSNIFLLALLFLSCFELNICVPAKYIFRDGENEVLRASENAQCDTNKKCGDKRVCNDDNFCECKKGYEGEDCSVVTGCKGDLGKKCKESGGDCIFDEDSSVKAICNCTKGFKYDPKENQCKLNYCKVKCGDAKCDGNIFVEEEVQCSCSKSDEDFDVEAKTCKKNYCKVKCGNAKCDGNKFVEGEVQCSCSNPDEDFDVEAKTCKMNYCKVKCGDAKCDGNIFLEDEVQCSCSKSDEDFDVEAKTCKNTCSDDSDCKNGGNCVESGSLKTCSCREGTEGPFCEKVHSCKDLDCGNEAKCILEKEIKTPVCRCDNVKFSFDKKDKKCKINKCKEHCGVEFGEKNHVICHGDPFGDDISCNCTNKTMDFILSTKICKVNKCKEKCGLHIGENGKVLCSGEPYGDKEVSCSCKDNSLKFSESEKDCKYQEKAKLSFFATFSIALTVMIGFVLIMATIVYCRQKSKQPQYSVKFSNQTISFESSLYDATNDSMSLFETRN